jgi:hypothetical protein
MSILTAAGHMSQSGQELASLEVALEAGRVGMAFGRERLQELLLVRSQQQHSTPLSVLPPQQG